MANLSCTWIGTYWQDDLLIRFEMVIVQGGNALSGNILDEGNFREAKMAGEATRSDNDLAGELTKHLAQRKELALVSGAL
jgi:hypothetical protein